MGYRTLWGLSRLCFRRWSVVSQSWRRPLFNIQRTHEPNAHLRCKLRAAILASTFITSIRGHCPEWRVASFHASLTASHSPCSVHTHSSMGVSGANYVTEGPYAQRCAISRLVLRPTDVKRTTPESSLHVYGDMHSPRRSPLLIIQHANLDGTVVSVCFQDS